MRFLFYILAFFAVSVNAATTIITGTVTVTNTPTDGATITVNGDVRTWKNTASTSSQIAVTNSAAASATNLWIHSLRTSFSGPIFPSITGSTSVAFRANTNQALTVTLSAGWGTVSYDTQTVTALQVVRVPQSSEPASVRTNVSSYLVTGIGTYSTNAFAETATALSNHVNVSQAQTLGNKTITNSTYSGGQLTNASLQMVKLSFDTTSTNKDALHFYDSAAARKYAIGPDVNGKPALFDVSSSTYMGTPASYTPSAGMLLSFGTATNAFGALGYANTWTATNTFSKIVGSSIYTSFITNSQAYITNLTIPDTTSSANGIVNMGGYRLLHNYGGSGTLSANLFVGAGAGNFTLTGTGNYSLGGASLLSLTSGAQNEAMGTAALGAVTTGSANLGLGYSAGGSISTGIGNVAVGNSSGPSGNYSYTTAVGLYAAPSASSYGALGGNTNTTWWSVPAGKSTSARAGFGGVIGNAQSSTANAAGGADTTLDTYTIKANTLGENGDSIRLRVHVLLTASASTDKRVKIKWGGTTIFDSGTFTQLGSNAYGVIDSVVTRNGSGTQVCVTSWTSGATNYKTDAQYASTSISDSADQAFLISASCTTVDILTISSKVFWEPTSH